MEMKERKLRNSDMKGKLKMRREMEKEETKSGRGLTKKKATNNI
jgi:hypothetical protein